MRDIGKRITLFSEWLSWGWGEEREKRGVFQGGVQNTDPQSMDYPYGLP